MGAAGIRQCGLALALAAGMQAAPEAKVTPSEVRMGLFYSGARMRLQGTVQAGSDVLAVLRGEDVEEVFNVKHRVGPIWLNSGSVHISGVPSIFLRFTSGAVKDVLPREIIDRHQLDIASIRHQMHIEPPPKNLQQIQESYLSLKTAEGKYQIVRDAVRHHASAGGRTAFTIDFEWPKKAPPGDYRAIVYEVRQGQVLGETACAIPVVMVGMAAWLAELAANRAALYGLSAILAALMAGFGMDLLTTRLFKKKRKPAAAGHRTPVERLDDKPVHQ